MLDRETRAFHADVDRGWHRLLQGTDTTREDYVHQLTMTYGFETPFEAACAYTPGLSQLIDLRGRSRSSLIAQDLLMLGQAAEDVRAIRCAELAPFQDAAEALAWLYVVERPTLLYAEVHEELTSRFVDLLRATSYLRAYEGTVSKRWSELGIALDQLCVSDKVCRRVLEAARGAFGALVDWQRASGRASQRRLKPALLPADINAS
jgi:heme oxygenase